MAGTVSKRFGGVPVDEWAELDRALDEMSASGAAEAPADGEWLARLAALQCPWRRAGKSALLHLWSGERNLSRRLLRVREHCEDRIVLGVQRFGPIKPGRNEFARPGSPRTTGRITREQFRAPFRRILAERFPDAAVKSLSTATDLDHCFNPSDADWIKRKLAPRVKGCLPSIANRS